jgi:uncharacterized membrane protein
MKTADIILIATTTAAALMAGLFYAYSCSVVIGLGKLNDVEYLKAMQSINKEILNPVFFAAFLGILPLLPLNTYLHSQQSNFLLLVAAMIVYLIGVFGVTVVGNIPLNNGLENFNILAADSEAIKAQRALFENKWNMLNHIRTVCSIVTVILLITGCLYKYRSTNNSYNADIHSIQKNKVSSFATN